MTRNQKMVTGQHKIMVEFDALQSEVEALKGLQAETSAENNSLPRALKGEW